MGSCIDYDSNCGPDEECNSCVCEATATTTTTTTVPTTTTTTTTTIPTCDPECPPGQKCCAGVCQECCELSDCPYLDRIGTCINDLTGVDQHLVDVRCEAGDCVFDIATCAEDYYCSDGTCKYCWGPVTIYNGMICQFNYCITPPDWICFSDCTTYCEGDNLKIPDVFESGYGVGCYYNIRHCKCGCEEIGTYAQCIHAGDCYNVCENVGGDNYFKQGGYYCGTSPICNYDDIMYCEYGCETEYGPCKSPEGSGCVETCTEDDCYKNECKDCWFCKMGCPDKCDPLNPDYLYEDGYFCNDENNLVSCCYLDYIYCDYGCCVYSGDDDDCCPAPGTTTTTLPGTTTTTVMGTTTTIIIPPGPVTFTYRPSDDHSLISCSLWTNISGNWQMEETDYSIINGVTNSFTRIVPSGTHRWHVECTDNASQSTFAPQDWRFTVT